MPPPSNDGGAATASPALEDMIAANAAAPAYIARQHLPWLQTHPLLLLPVQTHVTDDDGALASDPFSLALLPSLSPSAAAASSFGFDGAPLDASVFSLEPVGAAGVGGSGGSGGGFDTEEGTHNRSTLFGALSHQAVPAESTSVDIFFSMPALPDVDDEHIAEAMKHDAFGSSAPSMLGGFGTPPSLLGGTMPSEEDSQQALVPFDTRHSLLARVQRNPLLMAQQQLEQLSLQAAAESQLAIAAPAEHDHSSLQLLTSAAPADSYNDSLFSAAASQEFGSTVGLNLMGVGWRAPPSDSDLSSSSMVPASWTDRFSQTPQWSWRPALLKGVEGARERQERLRREEAREQDKQRAHIERIWNLMQTLHDPASRLAAETDAAEAAAVAAATAARGARSSQRPPSSAAFPHYPLESLECTPTFSQASWDRPEVHASIGENHDLGGHQQGPMRNQADPLASSEQLFDQILQAVGSAPPASSLSSDSNPFVLQEDKLVTEVLLALQAIGTSHIVWGWSWSSSAAASSSSKRCFRLSDPRLRLALVSSRALADLLDPILTTATQARELWSFVERYSATEGRIRNQPRGNDNNGGDEEEDADDYEHHEDERPEEEEAGLVLHAFAQAVEELLLQYTIALIQLPQTIRARRASEFDAPPDSAKIPITILEVAMHVHTLADRIDFLATLCRVPSSSAATSASDPSPFPRGAHLLDHLYSLCIAHSCDDASSSSDSGSDSGSRSVQAVVKVLYLSALRPYMNLVYDWTYRGVVRDPFREFIVEWREVMVDSEDAGEEDHGEDGQDGKPKCKVVLVPHRRPGVDLPLFLRPLETQIMHMGHTVQLLRVYQPRALLPRPLTAPGTQALVSPSEAAQRRLQASSQLAAAEAAARAKKASYAADLTRQIAEKDAALARAAQKALDASRAKEQLLEREAVHAAEVIAKERERLLRELELVRSPNAVAPSSSSLNKVSEWRMAREQLSPLRADKMLKIEEEHVKQLQQLMEATVAGTIATPAPAIVERKSDDELQPQRLLMGDDAKQKEESSSALVPIADSISSSSAVASSESVITSPSRSYKRRSFAPIVPPLRLPTSSSSSGEIVAIPSPASVPAVGAPATLPPAAVAASVGSASSSSSDTQMVLHASSAALPSSTAMVVVGAVGAGVAAPVAVEESKDDIEAVVREYEFSGAALMRQNDAPLPFASLHLQPALVSSTDVSGSEDSADVLSSELAERALDSLSAQFRAPSAAPLPVLLRGVLLPPLLSHAHSLARLGVSHFGSGETGYHMHLLVLRRYMLMQSGDLMDDFCQRLWGQVRRNEIEGVGQISPADAKTILEYCSKAKLSSTASSSSTSRASSLHHLAMQHLSFQVDDDAAATSSSSSSKRLDGLRGGGVGGGGLRLVYKVSYPLSLVLPAHTLSDYATVWTFLLQLQRVHQDLLWMWSHLQENEARVCRGERQGGSRTDRASSSSTPPSPSSSSSTLPPSSPTLPPLRSQLRTLHAARSEMHHFVLVLRCYMLDEVLEGGWARLQQDLSGRSGRASATSWVHIRDRHQEYIQHIVRACFRNPTTPPPDDASSASSASAAARPSAAAAAAAHSTSLISSALDKILVSVLDFKLSLSEATLDAALPPKVWQGLLDAHERFRSYLGFLYTLLQHQSTADLQSSRHSAHHITAKQLLSRIDFNRYYEQREQKK